MVMDQWQMPKIPHVPENSRDVPRIQKDGKSLKGGVVREDYTGQVGFKPNFDK